MLASIGVPLAIELMGKMFRKRLHIGPPPPMGGRGMHINPPLFFGSWSEYKKKIDVPLSNFDSIDWCKYLNIPIKGIFPPNEMKPLSSFTLCYQHGRFRKHGHSLGLTLAHKKWRPRILWLSRSAAAKKGM